MSPCTAGGTGGHIYPALAFIKEVQRRHPNVEFLYIGTENGLEKKIVERENIPFRSNKSKSRINMSPCTASAYCNSHFFFPPV